MKRYLNILYVAAFLTFAAGHTSNAQPGVAVSFSVFYDELSPYGVWVEDPVHGYVWVPDIGPDFHPYHTNGHWVLTEYGNTWVSFYDWGWAPFHYGRWVYDAFYGWVWVPGYEWGPAWVYWRYGGGYYGWAPLAPGFVVVTGFGIYNPPMDWWIFVSPRYLYHRNITRYVRDRRQNINIYNQTTVINNTYINRTRNTTYITGPARDDYKRVSGRDVTVHRVNDLSSRGRTYTRDNTVNIYRPEVQQSRAEAPAKVIRNTQPLREPAPVSTNENRPAPFHSEIERTRPERQIPQRAEPVERAPQRAEPVQRAPQRTEPVQRAPQRTEPVQRAPQRTEPVQRAPQRTEPVQRAPQRTEPVQRAPQRTEPVQRAPQRAEPVQRAPQRAEPVQRAPQRAEPVQRAPQRAEPVQRAPQRAEPVQRAPQRAEPVRR